jgi:hypothetical protein
MATNTSISKLLSLRNYPVGTIQGIFRNSYQNFRLLRFDNQSQREVGGSVTAKLSVLSRKPWKLLKLRAGQFSVATFSQVNQGKSVVQKKRETFGNN